MQVDVYNGHKTGGLLGLGIKTGSKNFLPGDFNIFMKSISSRMVAAIICSFGLPRI